jgi:FMN phosphatase YigB (HAD superfamily)
VTNGMTDNQLGKIRNTSLDKYVDAWCISDDVGIRKPDPRMFWAAAERCGAHAEFGGWIVGNSLALDIDGGAHAGLRTVWLTELALPASRPSVDRPPSGSLSPHATVTSVTEAVEIMLKARSRAFPAAWTTLSAEDPDAAGCSP